MCSVNPRSVRSSRMEDLSRMRMTSFSPYTVGRLDTRRSIFLFAAFTEIRPSCGSRRSAMSMSAMIFRRLTTPAWIFRDWLVISCSTPSMR